MQIQPYLFFDGRCEEAVEFYKDALGAEVELMMRYRDSPEPPPPGVLPPGWDNKIMHVTLNIGGAVLMASDGPAVGEGAPGMRGFALSLTAPDAAAAQRCFDALTAGGQVRMPLGPTFWSPCFGMAADRYGVGWMVTVPGA